MTPTACSSAYADTTPVPTDADWIAATGLTESQWYDAMNAAQYEFSLGNIGAGSTVFPAPPPPNAQPLPPNAIDPATWWGQVWWEFVMLGTRLALP
jgi:hypothetical protein